MAGRLRVAWSRARHAACVHGLCSRAKTAMQDNCTLLRYPNSGTHFKVGHVPLFIHTVAVEPSSQLVPHAARRHALQRERGHLQGLGCSSKGR